MRSSIIAAMSLLAVLIAAGAHATTAQSQAAQGQALAYARSKGNCLACHTMKGSDVPSNVGPKLSNMKARFPNRNELFGIIFDEEKRNPQTVMPAFGKNLILSKKEINAIIDFLYTM